MDLIYLAAGNSTRFGTNKLLYQLNGKCMYLYGLEVMEAVQQEHLIENIVLVTQYEEILQKVEKCFNGIYVVRNPHPEQGISGSIRLGVEKILNLEKECGKKHVGARYHGKDYGREGCMFAVADQPYLTVSSVRKMIQCWKDSDKGIVVSSHGEDKGNPVIFAPRYYTELSGLKGDVGGKQVIKKHLDDVQMFEMTAPELKDLDLPTEICELP